jgi:hypothetical protein
LGAREESERILFQIMFFHEQCEQFLRELFAFEFFAKLGLLPESCRKRKDEEKEKWRAKCAGRWWKVVLIELEFLSTPEERMYLNRVRTPRKNRSRLIGMQGSAEIEPAVSQVP